MYFQQVQLVGSVATVLHLHPYVSRYLLVNSDRMVLLMMVVGDASLIHDRQGWQDVAVLGRIYTSLVGLYKRSEIISIWYFITEGRKNEAKRKAIWHFLCFCGKAGNMVNGKSKLPDATVFLRVVWNFSIWSFLVHYKIYVLMQLCMVRGINVILPRLLSQPLRVAGRETDHQSSANLYHTFYVVDVDVTFHTFCWYTCLMQPASYTIPEYQFWS